MLEVFRVLAVVLTALATVPALAHVLELPGKMRLNESEYRIVQRIYYPGFTIVGIAEGAAPIVTFILLLLTPAGSREFWLILVALVGLIGVQTIFWFVTQPVNRCWMRSMALSDAGTTFFSTGRARLVPLSWTRLRDRWEISHVVRAGLTLLSLVLLVIAT